MDLMAGPFTTNLKKYITIKSDLNRIKGDCAHRSALRVGAHTSPPSTTSHAVHGGGGAALFDVHVQQNVRQRKLRNNNIVCVSLSLFLCFSRSPSLTFSFSLILRFSLAPFLLLSLSLCHSLSLSLLQNIQKTSTFNRTPRRFKWTKPSPPHPLSSALDLPPLTVAVFECFARPIPGRPLYNFVNEVILLHRAQTNLLNFTKLLKHSIPPNFMPQVTEL